MDFRDRRRIVASHVVELEIDHILTCDRHYNAFDVTTLPYRRPEWAL
ncbi:hypothetical protein [Natronomonas moolapensis]|jgi:predicted nucleic acid-binding protein|nr:hypothetical protein [Natronomonas moolapensis]